MFFSDKGYQCTMNTNSLSHQLSWSYGDIYNMTKSKSMFSPSSGAYILRMSVLYCNSQSNLMATYTKSKLCSLVIKDTNALWIPMHSHTSYPEVTVTYTTYMTQSKSMFSPSSGAYILRMSVLYCNSESKPYGDIYKVKVMFLSDKRYQCTMNTNALSHHLSWCYGDIYNITKSKSMFSPSWGTYILRMSVLYCNSESNLMATYTKSKSCSLVIKDTNALWIPMHYHTSYPEVMVTYTTWQSQNLCSALVEVHTY